MIDAIARTYRCACCNGALERAPDDTVPTPSIHSAGVETEETEFVCDECFARLASEHRRRMSAHATPKRKA